MVVLWLCSREIVNIFSYNTDKGSNCVSILVSLRSPIPVADRSKARVYGSSLAGIAGLNPAGGMDVCVVCCK